MTLKEAIEAVKELFDVQPFEKKEEGKSFYSLQEHGGATFFFDKRQYWRDDVISKLSEYFQDKYITDGQCRIDNITLLWTNVYLEPVGYQNRTEEEKEAEKKAQKEKFCNNFEKYRDEEFKQQDGTMIKLKNIPDDDIRAIVRKKLRVKTIQDYRVFQGELMYRINKGIWNPSEEKLNSSDAPSY